MPLDFSPIASADLASPSGAQASKEIDIVSLFEFASVPDAAIVLEARLFRRLRATFRNGAECILDTFGPSAGAQCLFLHVPGTGDAERRFRLRGVDRVSACRAGGWLAESSANPNACAYWIPQPAAHRSFDQHDRILVDERAPLLGFCTDEEGVSIDLQQVEALALECVVWRFSAASKDLVEELKRQTSIESTGVFLWSSQVSVRKPSDVYLQLIRGRVYQGTRAWPRKWKFCCELDAYEMFLWLTGLARSSGKTIYDLLRKQLLLSVIARQASDGGWYHGEWTDQFECHYRFHTGALLLLENALDEWDDPLVSASLARGIEFVCAQTDQTDLGVWFLHDSLEASPEAQDEMFRQTGKIAKGFGAWKPSRMLGKSPANKLILNTHVDTSVALARFARRTGNERLSELAAAALLSTKRLLSLRPAEAIYGLLYRAVKLTMLPATRGASLPLPVRAFKRLVWMYLLPRLYRVKRMMPRLVMPGGYIDRHLSPLHFDGKYHAVNVLDLVRLRRLFSDEPLDDVIDRGIDFVLNDGQATLGWWADEHPRRFAIVVFAEALYQLCMLRPQVVHRHQLARVAIAVHDLGLAMPPSVLGGNSEITPARLQVACPSPTDARLIVINLGRHGHRELLVINPTKQPIDLRWEGEVQLAVTWTDGSDTPVESGRDLKLAGRTWLVGRCSETDAQMPALS